MAIGNNSFFFYFVDGSVPNRGAGHIYERFVTFSFTLKLRNFDYPKEM